MALELNGEHTVNLPREQVWLLLNDPDVLSRIIPGCDSLTRSAEDHYELGLKLLVGSVSGNYKGSVALSEKNPPANYFLTLTGEGSIGFVNLLQATRLQRKGFDTSILLYGPGVTLGVQRGFPTLGDEAFPGHQNFNEQITKFIAEGGKVYACRFALQALYGHGEGALIEGIRPINPLDVLDIVLLHRKQGAFILDTWTL